MRMSHDFPDQVIDRSPDPLVLNALGIDGVAGLPTAVIPGWT